ncbi:SDR family NAD(P)-dependent oxidoreductase [Haliea salexigens]|uniref:SDR family NAD(P)-dependent oxidoreductase n=1 Tax=Haliea salexigens TaxID=287487 RepID=UPI000483EACE|nr:SDR family oxidoreductase [Haliea salexigens]
MSGRVRGLRALVTGAGQGLGRACAERLVQEGAEVIITDYNGDGGLAVAKEIGATFVRQDVSCEADWCALADQIAADGLQILVNNAGTEGRVDLEKDPVNADLEDWNKVFEVNTAGTFLACKYMTPIIARSGGGSIVNFSSVASLVPTPFLTAYGASKAAVEHLTKSIALHCAENGFGIRANSVHPGQVRTPMLEGLFTRQAEALNTTADIVAQEFVKEIPMRQFQDPVDIANLVLFLASSEARYVTGQSIACDGGYTLTH